MTIFDLAKMAKVDALPQVYELKPGVPYVCFVDPEKFNFDAVRSPWPDEFRDFKVLFIASRDGKTPPEAEEMLRNLIEEALCQKVV